MAVETATWRALAMPVARREARVLTFDDAARDHQDEIFGLALRILGDRDAAGDVASAVLLKAYRAFHRYDQSRPVRPWLLRITANEALSAARRIARERSRSAAPEEALAVADAGAGPERALVEREERERVRAAVVSLPELYRLPVVLRYFNDLSLEEIGDVTGRSVSTIGVQLLRGRALLRSALEGTP
ncbi:MAG: sigma-70 family RNA polymerase sigma factor [Chloroflexi bacterium]|nr:sigma-70 family RNA polymerase sigma factor [Chloroflexota bacterium]